MIKIKEKLEDLRAVRTEENGAGRRKQMSHGNYKHLMDFSIHYYLFSLMLN